MGFPYCGLINGHLGFLEKTPMLQCWERLKAGGEEISPWYHHHNGHEFEQTPRDGEGQGSLACCSLWSHKELDTT